MSRVNAEREAFIERFRICSVKGRLYSRPELRAYVRRAFRHFPAEHIAEAVALIADDAWLARRRGTTPSSVVRDAKYEVYGTW